MEQGAQWLLQHADSQQDVQPTHLCQRGGTPTANTVLSRTYAVIAMRCLLSHSRPEPFSKASELLFCLSVRVYQLDEYPHSLLPLLSAS